jgi:hypothetical protein
MSNTNRKPKQFNKKNTEIFCSMSLEKMNAIATPNGTALNRSKHLNKMKIVEF